MNYCLYTNQPERVRDNTGHKRGGKKRRTTRRRRLSKVRDLISLKQHQVLLSEKVDIINRFFRLCSEWRRHKSGWRRKINNVRSCISELCFINLNSESNIGITVKWSRDIYILVLQIVNRMKATFFKERGWKSNHHCAASILLLSTMYHIQNISETFTYFLQVNKNYLFLALLLHLRERQITWRQLKCLFDRLYNSYFILLTECLKFKLLLFYSWRHFVILMWWIKADSNENQIFKLFEQNT